MYDAVDLNCVSVILLLAEMGRDGWTGADGHASAQGVCLALGISPDDYRCAEAAAVGAGLCCKNVDGIALTEKGQLVARQLAEAFTGE